MRSQTGLVRRGAVYHYHYRHRIPRDLLLHYGRREIKRSLNTKDKGEATRLAAAERTRAGENMNALFAYWQSQAERRPNTVREFKTAVQQWNTQHPNLPTRQITRAHVVAFRDAQLKGRSPRTVKNNQRDASRSPTHVCMMRR